MSKKNLILGGVLVVLIVLALAYRGPIKKWQANLGKPKNFFSKIDMLSVDKMEIVKDGKTVVLEKEGEKWKIGGIKDFYAAESDAKDIKEILSDAAKESLELVSANKDNKKEFQTDEGGVSVKLLSGEKEALDFIVGKAGSEGGSYISRQSLKETYFIKLDLSRIFNKDEWRDKTIFSFAKEKIFQVRFQYPDREFTIEKKGDKWEGVKPKRFSVDKEKMDKILSVLSNLYAVAIPEQNFKGTELEKHLIIIEATGEGTRNILMVGEKNKDGLYFAKRGDSDNIYLISKIDRDELDKKVEQLK